MGKKEINIDELFESMSHQGDAADIPVAFKTPKASYTSTQLLTRYMSTILLGIFVAMVIASLCFWDGKQNGPFADLWEYTKLVGTMIIGGVVATYLQPTNNDR